MTVPMRDHASRFIHSLRFDDLPEPVVRDALRRVLDLLGVAAAGIGTALSSIAREHALDCFGAGRWPARMLFDGRTVSAAGMAFAGATTIDSFDGHDGHSLTKGHVGVTVLPAVLAMAQGAAASDGREFLTQIVLGYEIGTRAGIALHATSREYHTSGAWNALAAAAIAARTLRFDLETTRHTLGIAEYHGPRSDMMRCIDHPTMLKDGSGWGALAGISAALLAARGFTGAPAVTVEQHAETLWSDLGERWLILDQYVKPYPVCRWAHPAIAAALRVRESLGEFGGEDVETVTIHSFHEATRLWSTFPRNTEEAQYGVLFPVAAALADGRVDADTVTARGLNDTRLAALVTRMKLVDAPSFSAAFPAERWARVVVQLRDGRSVDSGPMQANGNADSPLDDATQRAKFYALTGARFGESFARALEADVLALASPGRSLDSFMQRVLSEPV